MANQIVPAIEPAGVSTEKIPHACRKSLHVRLNEQMEVVRHKAVRQRPPGVVFANRRQSREEAVAIRIVKEYLVLVVAPRHHVVES